ncbi:TetR/AcrR family transcriptional regulator [Demequina sp.]|uniref:TetR/AcrR family transcriptional regulator n=1 Tax=Demequina sp. TaxID=2050685 RepID=UPI003A83E1AF
MTKVPKTNRGPVAGPENRAALIAAARAVFDERGLDAPLSAVARKAGVGQGSLYRHFPDRTALAVAVFEENLVELEALAARPGSTLRDVVDLATYQAQGAAAFIETIIVARADARVQEYDARLRAVLADKWAQASESGAVAPGTTSDDLMLALGMVAMFLSHAPRAQRAEIAERAWGLLGPGLGRLEAP